MTPDILKHWRDTMGWSARRAAQEIGVHPNTYYHWERGEHDGKPVEVPPWVGLVCSALYHRLPSWDAA